MTTTDDAILALYNAVRDTLQANGMEHGTASVVILPDGTWLAVAREQDEAPLEVAGDLGDQTPKTGVTPIPPPPPGPFVPGGGTFGGGGASGSW